MKTNERKNSIGPGEDVVINHLKSGLMKDFREENKGEPIPEHIKDNMRKDRIGRPLCCYLEKMRKAGKNEFRIAMQSDKHFIIHPMNVDGETLDIKWDGEEETVLAIW